MIIPKEEWSKCNICNLSISDINKKYKKQGMYKSEYFKEHLEKDHNTTLSEYFPKKHKCPCNICNKFLEVTTKGSNIVYKKMACGRTEGTLKWAKEAKTTRKGSGNPMFKKKPWNTGLSKEISKSIMEGAKKRIGRKTSEDTRKKQSESAKKRKIHGHTGHRHSEDTKNKLRINTLKMIKDGKYKQTNTKPFLTFERFLNDLNIKYEKEKVISHWSFDFFLIDYSILIEVDGDYFHSNPKLYPNGPETKTQRVNHYRDLKKNQFCIDSGLKLVRFWESDIFGAEECVKQKLSILKK